MGHEHGREYQLKIVLRDGTEKLTGWLDQEQIAVLMSSACSKSKTTWLQERNVLCPSCPDRDQKILEYPVSNTESSRFRPHDSRYLMAAGVRNRSEFFPPK